MFSTVFCLSFLPWFLVCIFVPFGCHMDAKEVRKRPQGHPFGQQKLAKLALDHGCENMAPMQWIAMFSWGGTFQILCKFRLKCVFKDIVPGSFLWRGFSGQFLLNFVDFGNPSDLSLRALGTPGDTQNWTNLKILSDCVHRGGQEGALEASRIDFGGHFGSLFDIIH